MSVLSTVLSRLNAFIDSEIEQILCFETVIDIEKCWHIQMNKVDDKKNKVVMYLDEIGTILAIQSAEMMFSASRSRNINIVAII